MRLGGRLAAAIEVLEDIGRRHRPVADALKDWGLSHRFAGGGDRAAIGNIVYDALRHRSCLRRPVSNIRDPASIWELLSPAGAHLPAGNFADRDRGSLVAANAAGVQSRRERLSEQAGKLD